MTTPGIDDDFTELIDFRPDRVDLVGKGANGIPRFLIAKQAGDTGLLDSGFVRDLIAKADPDAGHDRERVPMPNGITLNGSPADIAAFIHKAALAARERDDPPADLEAAGIAKALAEYEQVVKAKYDAADRKRMAGNGQAMSGGEYPIADEDDLDKAIHAVGRGSQESHNAIRKHVMARAKALGKSSEIPGNWAADGSLKQKVSKDMGPELDEGADGLDPTIPLAAPEEMGPGDPTDPGSPAWESIDAATASKWTSVFARGKNALAVLAEREMLEAASADPGDAENAMDLQEGMCALDFVISILAPFAVGEQAEADCGAAEMEAIGKAAAAADSPLAAIEGLTAVRKAGRVLSASNEAKIRDAAKALGDVLASLPSAPQAETVTKEKGAPMPATTTAQAAPVAKAAASPDEQARDTGPVQAGGTTGMGLPRTTGPAASLPGDGPQQARPGDLPDRKVVKAGLPVAVYDQYRRIVGVTDPARITAPVAKADGDGEKKPMQAVFDQDGDLIGIVDPDAIMPVTGAGAKPSGDTAATAPDPGDMTPQPAADAGTPADTVGKAAGEDVITVTQDVLKSIAQDAATAALAAQGAAHQEVVAKMAADNGEMAEELKVVKARLDTVENSAAPPRVFTNGQVPPAATQLRGQDQGTFPKVDVAKALERKQALYGAADAPGQDRIFKEMQGDAVAALAAIHAAGRR